MTLKKKTSAKRSVFSGNIGEWSEVYVFLKLLAEGKFYAADKSLKRVSSVVFPVVKILRHAKFSKYAYHRSSKIRVCSYPGSKPLFEIPADDFGTHAENLLQEIQSNKSVKGGFRYPELEVFLKNLMIEGIKANSRSKRDITITIYDERLGDEKDFGFSIKSQLGSPSTLINAGETTNFIFKVCGSSHYKVSDVNQIYNSKGHASVQGRLRKLISEGKSLSFYGMHSRRYSRNLQVVDSFMPIILSSMVQSFYLGEGSTVKELTKRVTELNPCGYDMSELHSFYELKVKNFLTDSALGLLPGTKWDGQYDADGGYLIVKPDGDVLCYHIYDRNEFQEYLFGNTKFETAGTGKHKYGEIYTEHGQDFIKLNLQVRFKK